MWEWYIIYSNGDGTFFHNSTAVMTALSYQKSELKYGSVRQPDMCSGGWIWVIAVFFGIHLCLSALLSLCINYAFQIAETLRFQWKGWANATYYSAFNANISQHEANLAAQLGLWMIPSVSRGEETLICHIQTGFIYIILVHVSTGQAQVPTKLEKIYISGWNLFHILNVLNLLSTEENWKKKNRQLQRVEGSECIITVRKQMEVHGLVAECGG